MAFQEAVRTLNTLQSNAAVIDKIKKERAENKHMIHSQTIEFANRAGLTVCKIDNLQICTLLKIVGCVNVNINKKSYRNLGDEGRIL